MKGSLTVSAFLLLTAGGAVGVAAPAPNRRPMLVVQSGHAGRVNSAVFSPDGKYVLTAGSDLTARLWDGTTGDELRVFSGHEAEVDSALFSPDGKTVLTASNDGTTRLWEVRTGREIRRFPTPLPGGSIIFPGPRAVFSPDGKRILTPGEHSAAVLWDIASGREVRRFPGNGAWAWSLAFSADGKWILGVALDTVGRLWEAETGKEIAHFGAPDNRINFAGGVFSPDGQRLLLWKNDGASLFDRASGHLLRVFKRGILTACAGFNPDGRLVCVADSEGAVDVRETETGRRISQFKTAAVWSVQFSRNGERLLTACGDSVSRLWSNRTGALVREFKGYAVHPRKEPWYGACPPTVSPDGKLLMTSSESGVGVWDTATGAVVGELRGHVGEVQTADFAGGGRLIVTTGWDETLRIWDRATRKELFRWAKPRTARLSDDGKQLFAVDSWGEIRVVDVALAKETRTFAKQVTSISYGVFSRDAGVVLVLRGSFDASVWNTRAGTEIRRFESKPGAPIDAAAMSPDGRWVLTRTSRELVTPVAGYGAHLLEVSTGREVAHFPGQGGCGAFSPDGLLLLTGGIDGTARIWETVTGKPLHVLRGHPREVTVGAFSPDSRRVITEATIFGGDPHPDVHLWDTASGREIARLEGPVGGIASVTFTPDSKWVIGAEEGGGVTIWSAESGETSCHLLTFADGTWLVTDPEGRFDTNRIDDVKGVRWVLPDEPMRALPPEIFLRTHYQPRLLARVLAGDRLPPVPSVSSLNRSQPEVKITEATPAPGQSAELDVTVTASRGPEVGGFPPGEPFNLRLFRDGQLVGMFPADGGKLPLDRTTGGARHTFRVRLPQRADLARVELTAYAFNQSQVKSANARVEYALPTRTPDRQGRAYVLTFGVNATGNPRWDLRFAAPDARLMASQLTSSLTASGRYSAVVTVPLISDEMASDATRGNLKTALARLAGRPLPAGAAQSFPGGETGLDRLQPARPEDLVVLAFAGHGFADVDGAYYLFPSEVGGVTEPGVTPAHLATAISSAQLAAWLQDVDAGDLVLVVDACNSGAVEEPGFKPGPMGSRGLGQLAYDKGMRILAATQADDVAFEFDQLRHGLLTYALVQEGLEAGRADLLPKDEQIMLDEWLAFAAQRVPLLCDEIMEHRFTPASRGVKVVGTAGSLQQPERRLQAPALFDFRRQRRDVLVARLRAR